MKSFLVTSQRRRFTISSLPSSISSLPPSFFVYMMSFTGKMKMASINNHNNNYDGNKWLCQEKNVRAHGKKLKIIFPMHNHNVMTIMKLKSICFEIHSYYKQYEVYFIGDIETTRVCSHSWCPQNYDGDDFMYNIMYRLMS